MFIVNWLLAKNVEFVGKRPLFFWKNVESKFITNI